MREALRKFAQVLASAAGAGILLVILYFIFWAGKISTDDAEVDAHLASVSPQISGKVLKVAVDDNQEVNQGDLLVVIDSKDYRAKLAEARAAALLAEKQYQAAVLDVPVTSSATIGASQESEAEAGAAGERIKESLASVSQAAANLRASTARLQLASENFKRMKILIQNYVISKEQIDSARSAYETASEETKASAAALRQKKKELEESRDRLAAALGRAIQTRGGALEVREKKSQAQAARARWQEAKADLALASLQMGYTEIRAPVGGIVTRREAEPGEVVVPGQMLLMISPNRPIWVTADFKETDLRKMKVGQKAAIRVDAYPDKTLKGTVDSVGGATGSRTSLFPPENATGNYVKVVQRIPVKIVFDPGEDTSRLRAGMSVEATVYVR